MVEVREALLVMLIALLFRCSVILHNVVRVVLNVGVQFMKFFLVLHS